MGALKYIILLWLPWSFFGFCCRKRESKEKYILFLWLPFTRLYADGGTSISRET